MQQFDTRTANPVLSALNNVGVEKGLYFQSFVVVNTSLTLTAVFPHSGTNEIATAVEQQDLTGTPAITSIYSGSEVRYFTLKSFYFGCEANSVVSVADVALQCTIFVAGFKDGQEKGSATYTFSPTAANVVRPSMIQAKLPDDFVELQNVTVIQDNPKLKALVLDDINVMLYS
ncbi:MAG: hypothetical protein Q9201_000695 [Fulgogasparrea decipioides]